MNTGISISFFFSNTKGRKSTTPVSSFEYFREDEVITSASIMTRLFFRRLRFRLIHEAMSVFLCQCMLLRFFYLDADERWRSEIGRK